MVAAAVRTPDGLVFSVARPGRHHTILHLMVAEGLVQQERHEQGFLLSDGRFCRRKPAKIVAERAGQLLPHASKSSDLFSEDVW